ncbi:MULTISPECIES: caspase family protein [unclassified Mycobacterium]|uniref:caspase family protein n=1 Tax=unclassified Mycobacterium TaxID=2642494 RepID=UPI0029C74A78|nr:MULTISPECIES: caspase family protein [unclassified Mycobacterium]
MPDNQELVFDAGPVSPGTHALVIGVGDYPHLIGGSEPTSPHADGMQQLTSPPVSAREFADWLRAEYQCTGRPLASLAFLLSEPGQAQDVPLANSTNVVEAVREWKRRAAADPANRLIFFFCGHGVSQGEDMALLLSDFGADDDNPLNGALDFRQLVGGLKKCAASEQVFFVDACRASSDMMIERAEGFAGVVPLLPGTRPPEFGPQAPVTYYATLTGARSHGRPNAASLFTAALLKSLRGAGSDEHQDGEWSVLTGRLQDALNDFLKEPSFAGRLTLAQVPVANNLTSYELHRLRGLPSVPVYVGCETPDENAQAKFICRTGGVEKEVREPDGNDGQWVLELPFGDYEFEAIVTPTDIRTKSQTVRPISRRLTLVAPQ